MILGGQMKPLQGGKLMACFLIWVAEIVLEGNRNTDNLQEKFLYQPFLK